MPVAAVSMAELRLPRPTLVAYVEEVGVGGCGWLRAAKAMSTSSRKEEKMMFFLLANQL